MFFPSFLIQHLVAIQIMQATQVRSWDSEPKILVTTTKIKVSWLWAHLSFINFTHFAKVNSPFYYYCCTTTCIWFTSSEPYSTLFSDFMVIKLRSHLIQWNKSTEWSSFSLHSTSCDDLIVMHNFTSSQADTSSYGDSLMTYLCMYDRGE